MKIWRRKILEDLEIGDCYQFLYKNIPITCAQEEKYRIQQILAGVKGVRNGIFLRFKKPKPFDSGDVNLSTEKLYIVNIEDLQYHRLCR